MNKNVILSLKGINKIFSSVQALNDINLDILSGETHSLVGANGAGKSTLIKILARVYKESSGEIFLNGSNINQVTSEYIRNYGIDFIFQELELIENFSVAQNILLGIEPTKKGFINWNNMEKQAQKYLDMLIPGFIKAREKVRNLTIAQKQLVCIARALYRNPRVLVLDEPTSRLSKTETEALFEVINKLKREQNITVIFVSHRMEEIFEISDRITILKDGKKVGTFEKSDITHDQVVEYMVGKDIFYNKEEIDFSTIKSDSTPLLEINNLEIHNMYGPVSFKVFPGEIFGITGAVGSKKTEIIETIFGLRKKDNGKIIINGKDVKNINPRKAISMNISLVPEDRRNSGIIYDFSVKNNSTLSYLKNYTKLHSFLDFNKEKKDSMKMIDRLSIKTTSEKKLLRYLSGGNQQKVVIAKWLLGEAKIYFFDEPTIGIDVKGKEEIYKIIRELSREGNAVVVASSDIDEILPLVHKTTVLFKGKQMKEFSTNDVDKKTLLYLTMGGNNNE